MERIICIEQPFHESVDFGVSSALSVIQKQQRYRERNTELYQPVYFIDSEEIYNGIYRSPEHRPGYLLFRLSPVCAYGQHAQRRYTAPIGRQGDGADKQSQNHLCRHFDSVVVRYSQQDESPCERPYDARLVEDIPIIKRNKRVPVCKIV